MVITFDIQSHSNVCYRPKFEAGIYFWTSRENITHCFLVGNVTLFELHCCAIAAFPGISLSDWTVYLNTWNTNKDSEDTGRRDDKSKRARKAQNHRRQEKRENVDLDMMALGNINLKEVGTDKDLDTYENVWEASSLNHSIDTPHSFWVRSFLEAMIRR